MINKPKTRKTVLNPSYSPLNEPLGKMPKDIYARTMALIPEWELILAPYSNMNQRDKYILTIAGICRINGARINEVLTMKWSQVLPSGMASIKGSKGSNSRFIFIGFSASEVRRLCPSDRQKLVFHSCYREVWRTMKSYDLGESIEGHVNQAVTHAGRYRLARAVASSLGMVSASEVIGHKSKTAIDHYTNNVDTKKERERKQRARRRLLKDLQTVYLPRFLEEDWGA